MDVVICIIMSLFVVCGGVVVLLDLINFFRCICSCFLVFLLFFSGLVWFGCFLFFVLMCLVLLLYTNFEFCVFCIHCLYWFDVVVSGDYCLLDGMVDVVWCDGDLFSRWNYVDDMGGGM